MAQQTSNEPEAQPQPQPEAPQRESAWVGAWLLRAVSVVAMPDRVADGAELARLNRVVRMDVVDGRIDAHVRDRSTRPERVLIEVQTHAHDVWERALEHMADQPAHAARLLAGMLPEDIESALAPSGVALFPSAREMKPACRCDDPEPWCRHACAVAATLARRLDETPLVLFTLRGMPADEAMERIRQRRAVQGRAGGAAPAYAQRPVPGGDATAPTLESDIEGFWNAGPELETLDTSLRRPEVWCALLRRLGPSPLQPAKFPLLGLLETCYSVISETTTREPEPGDASEDGGPDPDSDPDEEPEG